MAIEVHQHKSTEGRLIEAYFPSPSALDSMVILLKVNRASALANDWFTQRQAHSVTFPHTSLQAISKRVTSMKLHLKAFGSRILTHPYCMLLIFFFATSVFSS